jgi:hypothetical protein
MAMLSCPSMGFLSHLLPCQLPSLLSFWNAATSERKRGLPGRFSEPVSPASWSSDVQGLVQGELQFSLRSPLGVPDDRELAFSRELVSYQHASCRLRGLLIPQHVFSSKYACWLSSCSCFSPQHLSCFITPYDSHAELPPQCASLKCGG